MAKSPLDPDFDWSAGDVFQTLGRERVAELTDEITRKAVDGMVAIDRMFMKRRPR